MSVPLPHPDITPPPGAQLDSAALAAIFAEIQRNFDALTTGSSSFLQGNGRAAWGASSLHFPGSTASETRTVEHKLGKVPRLVVATGKDVAFTGNLPILVTGGYTTAAFNIFGETTSLAGPGDVAFTWLAIT
jgi:hypothetical protein